LAFFPWDRVTLPPQIKTALSAAPSAITPDSREALLDLALGGAGADRFDVEFDVPDMGRVKEATVVHCRNGIGVNFIEPYMRRRDPDCLLIADHNPSDKSRFESRFGYLFGSLRVEILEWLGTQKLIVQPFRAGGPDLGYDTLLVAPENAAFFAAALADLQGMLPLDELPEDFRPRAIIYLAPPFRHTHCDGRQVVVHNRINGLHEIFSLNLYLGPSAKKGVYGILLHIGEEEGWITAHGATVEVVTPYDNILTVMHEGASGGGKSEMLSYPHREADGRLLLGQNLVTGQRRLLTLTQGCELRPVTDDMAICHPHLQNGSRRLVVRDGEEAWFIRLDHITGYGIDPNLERICIHPPEPVVFLNLHAVPDATCLVWEPVEDRPGVLCPNPRVILPRRLVPGVVNGPVEVDVRNFGVRTPPCTREHPSYGIAGLLHLLPPALAWLWRLVAPRGYDNPSITTGDGLVSEGVGSFWPFATGRRVIHANLLLKQIQSTPSTRYTLTPNQHIGAWKVGFMPQWIAREYLARRSGAKFRPDQLKPARCPLLGYAIRTMQVEGAHIPEWLLEVNLQSEVGDEAYDAGAEMLQQFFEAELRPYLSESELDPQGRQIIECCLNRGSLEDYLALFPLT
jgi:hypothetical protein